MELGPYTLQIFVSLLVILGAAFVALVCDFLKGNNEQLRELTLELKIRREEEHKRYRVGAAPVLTPAMATASPAPPMAAPVAEKSENNARRTPSPAAIAAMDRGEQLATMRRPKGADRTAAAAATASMVETMMASRAARKAEAPAAASAGLPAAPAAKPAKVETPLRESLLTPAPPAPAKIEKPAVTIPAGFQDGFVLSNLVKNRQPVSGLVVSIGVNAPKDDNNQLPEPVKDVIRGLLGPDDFAAQTSADEFLLIMPKEHGAAAQRRLSQIAQQLWDFQLRSLGKYSILFSWGGVEVERESIDEAIASASERMQETKRGRKILTMEPRNAQQSALRKAV